MLPAHRYFAFLLTRVLMENYVRRLTENDEEHKAGEESELPPTKFHEYLVCELFVDSPEEL